MAKKKETKKKEVAVKQPTEVAVPVVNKEIDRNVGNEDLILPRLELLQALSPSVVKDGATPGIIVNNLTKEDLGSPTIVPIYLTKNWIRWRPRHEGGGMVWRSDDPTDPKVIEESKWGADGAKPLATAYLNFLCLVSGDSMPVIVSFCNTSYKTGRKLLTLVKMSPGHLFDSRFELSATSQTNNKGTFFVFDVKKIGPSTSEERAAASEIGSMFAGKDLNFEAEGGAKSTTTEGLGDEF